MGQMLLTGAGGGASNVLASVPWVAQWKFNNNGNDSIGANNLTNNNSATFTTGKLGGATGATQLVAASSQYWSITDNAVLSIVDSDYTLALWCYFDSLAANRGLVGHGVAGNRTFALMYNTGSNRFRLQYSADGTNVVNMDDSVLGAPSINTWYCVLIWHDSVADTINLQINNGTVQSNSLSGGLFDCTAAFEIGRNNINPNQMDGRIDNVCIAKSAAGAGGVLSAAQRTAFFNAGVGTETLS